MALFPSLGVIAVAALLSGEVVTYLVAFVVVLVVAGAAYLALRSLMVRPSRRPRAVSLRRRPLSSPALARRGGSARDTGWQPAPIAGGAGATLRERGGDGREFALGNAPAVIGASDATCTIVLDGDGVAPEHARIWMRQGRYLLHHVGGLSRKTYVSGQEADWVVLESGDEVTIGRYRLIFEDTGGLAPEAAPDGEDYRAKRDQGIDDDLAKMEVAVRELWAEALPASETAVGERAGTGKFKVHRRKEELAERVGGHWVKRGRTVVLER